MRDLTGHKITDRKRGAPLHATKKWIANTQKVDRRPAPGSLHRLVGHSVLCGQVFTFSTADCKLPCDSAHQRHKPAAAGDFEFAEDRVEMLFHHWQT
jgi:hypothetical protein